MKLLCTLWSWTTVCWSVLSLITKHNALIFFPVHCVSFFLFFFFCTSYCFLHILLFFAHLFCTSYCLLHILLFFAHLIVLHFFYFIAHFTLISLFLTIYMPLCYVTLYNLYSYYFALSTERTWFDYISLLIIPCITIMWQIKKPWTLEPSSRFPFQTKIFSCTLKWKHVPQSFAGLCYFGFNLWSEFQEPYFEYYFLILVYLYIYKYN